MLAQKARRALRNGTPLPVETGVSATSTSFLALRRVPPNAEQRLGLPGKPLQLAESGKREAAALTALQDHLMTEYTGVLQCLPKKGFQRSGIIVIPRGVAISTSIASSSVLGNVVPVRARNVAILSEVECNASPVRSENNRPAAFRTKALS